MFSQRTKAFELGGDGMQVFQAITQRLAATLVVLTIAGSVAAEQATQKYSVRVSGLNAGSITLATDVSETRFAARGIVKANGLLALVSDFGFDGTAHGVLANLWDARPRNYQGEHKNRGGARSTTMSFSGNRPTAVTITPPRRKRDHDVDPFAQSGTVDPVTAGFMLLRDRPLAQACDQRVEMFDGAKRSRISLGAKQANGDGWICNGVYERRAGFSPREMEKQRRFNFTIYLSERDGLVVVDKFVTQSTAGKIVATRR